MISEAILVRFTKEEKKEIAARAKKNYLSMSNQIRVDIGKEPLMMGPKEKKRK